jgi:uncharacterized protein (DUF3084 family)
VTPRQTEATGRLVALYRERLVELRENASAHAWGGLRHEAALGVLGGDATADAIASLIRAASRNAP